MRLDRRLANVAMKPRRRREPPPLLGGVSAALSAGTCSLSSSLSLSRLLTRRLRASAGEMPSSNTNVRRGERFCRAHDSHFCAATPANGGKATCRLKVRHCRECKQSGRCQTAAARFFTILEGARFCPFYAIGMGGECRRRRRPPRVRARTRGHSPPSPAVSTFNRLSASISGDLRCSPVAAQFEAAFKCRPRFFL